MKRAIAVFVLGLLVAGSASAGVLRAGRKAVKTGAKAGAKVTQKSAHVAKVVSW